MIQSGQSQFRRVMMLVGIGYMFFMFQMLNMETSHLGCADIEHFGDIGMTIITSPIMPSRWSLKIKNR